MKKMRIKRNKDVDEIVSGLKVAGAAALEFVAMVIAIPARIMLLVAKGLDGVAQKLAGTEDIEVIDHVDVKNSDIIAEITDV